MSKSLVLLAFVAVTGTACQGCHLAAKPDDRGPADADAGQGSGDADIDGSSDEVDSDVSSELLEFDPGLWSEGNPCEGVVNHEDVDSEFSLPDNPPDDDPKQTRDRVIQRLGGVPRQGNAVTVDPALQPADRRPYQLYATPGTDVSIYLAVFNNFDDLSSFRLNVTTMIDYEPVEATYERWSPDRSEKLFEKTTTGINYDITSDVELVDITIPGSAFPEERMYEISLNYEVMSIPTNTHGSARRFALFNGGFERPDSPCAESPLDEPATSFEAEVVHSVGPQLAMLFHEGIRQRDDINHLIPVEPGATRQLYLSVLHISAPLEEPAPTALVPVMNGKPIGELWWVSTGGPRSDQETWQIDARKTFEVTFPEEPGIYEVMVASWLHPWELYRNPDGSRNEGVSEGSELQTNSNVLRFRVVDQSP